MSTDRTKEIEEIASAWLTRRDSNHWTDADQAQLDEWLEESVLHHVTFLRLELGWDEAHRLKALGAGIEGDEPPPPGKWNLTPFFQSAGSEPDEMVSPAAVEVKAPADREFSIVRRPWPASLAASLILLTVLAWRLWPAGHDYETPVGGMLLVPIADGSKVTLNTDSQVRVMLSDRERRIELSQGEIFVDVAKDPTRPLIVLAGSRQVIAVGTQFSVRRDADDIQVVVTEGQVRVADASSARSLTAGSVARAMESGILVQKTTVLEAEERLSWRSGVLMFRDETLREAVAEFNRYNVRQIVIEDPAAAEMRIEGNFRSTNVDAFARLLEEVYPVTVRFKDADHLIIGAR